MTFYDKKREANQLHNRLKLRHIQLFWLTSCKAFSPMIQSKYGKIFQFSFFLAFGLFLIWLTTKSFSKEDISHVVDLILSAKLSIVIPCMLILTLSHFVRALRWKMLITPLGHQPGILNIFLSVILGFFFNLLFPRLGEVMKCSLLGKHEKIPVDKLIGTMVAERLIDLLCLIFVIALTIYTQFELVGNYSKELWISFKLKLNALSGNFPIIVLGLIFVAIILFIIFRSLKKFHFYEKAIQFLKGLLLGLMSFRKISNKPLFILYTLSIWFLYLYSIKFGFLALKEMEHLGWIPSLTILTFGSFAMIATQGGIGAYQLAIQKTLTLYGIQEVSGLAFGWLLWSVQTVMLLICGPIAWFLMIYLNKRKRHTHEHQ